MAFYPVSGDWKVKYFRKKASAAFTANNLVAFETNGTAGDPCEPADASDTKLIGIGMRTITSASSDYADNTRIPVLVPISKDAVMECDTVAGTMAVADEGLEVDISDAASANRAASSTDVLVATQFTSTTKGQFIINKPILV
jgi:hypothetical protein